MFDRFEFEEALTKLENSQEIYDVGEAILEKNLSEDEIANVLFGLYELQKIRFNKVFDMFENGIKEEKIT